ncbi:carboxymuconolactone decarboxylase [Bifidobacterium actinocoloniiforme DSM 22766]|uniref:Carboxymuconolactone decarboxylase n=1 Tax=Bifidobacterium actinocoloniiforme DSM 22766 TaxID=1437605 RepID=A0A086Z2F1_9BIFI|nr:carboxymuconolactone decarboxylase family protein [Bifidobacterium actinocoloniiforme]AKV55704.1 carboxymuconolactone decarboxylase [Bifidobacterium actinocoloniiforme DSM 22766]KFI40701.1 carboxymuconolactone decarboxylase [Bifidobacterium actinocoloniiforme DSM 22766]
MAESRFERGSRILASIDGEGGQAVVESLQDIAPDLGKWIVEFAFGDVYADPTLDARQRELVTLGSLVTQGDTTPQLRVHIAAALHVGLTKSEVVQAVLQTAPYVGFPRVINAVNVAREVFRNQEAGDAPTQS